MSEILKYILGRSFEPTTWAGVGVLVALLFGVDTDAATIGQSLEAVWEHGLALFGAVTALIAILLPERGTAKVERGE